MCEPPETLERLKLSEFGICTNVAAGDEAREANRDEVWRVM